MFPFRFLWKYPYATVISLPYFFSDIWEAFVHLSNNVDVVLARLCDE